MRISDWSSDVCSSDLAGEDCHQGGFARAIGPEQTEHAAGRHVEGEPAQCRVLRAGILLANIASVNHESQLRLVRRAADRRRWCSSRSEEHTSELQSLMRKSYAVLCLKKKRSTQQTIMKT